MTGSLFRLFAEDEKNKDLKVNSSIKANAAVGNTNLKGMQLNRGVQANQLRIQDLKASGRLGEAQQLQIQSAGELGTNSLSTMSISGRGAGRAAFLTPDALKQQQQAIASTIPEGVKQTVAETGKSLQNLKTTKGATDAAAAAKMFDGTKAGFAKGMNAVALGAAVIEKWGQRFAKQGWAGIGAGHKQEQLGRGLVEDEQLPF